MQHGTFVKKPISVEAVLWDGSIEALIKIEEMIGDGPQADFTKSGEEYGQCIIPTLEGDMKGNIGDWIIKARGECYPCKPDIFKATYSFVSSLGFSFGQALEFLKAGKRVARFGWNGKGMWLNLQVPDEYSKMTLPYVYIEYPEGHPAYNKGSRVPWLASQTDMLAEDWFEV